MQVTYEQRNLVYVAGSNTRDACTWMSFRLALLDQHTEQISPMIVSFREAMSFGKYIRDSNTRTSWVHPLPDVVTSKLTACQHHQQLGWNQLIRAILDIPSSTVSTTTTRVFTSAVMEYLQGSDSSSRALLQTMHWASYLETLTKNQVSHNDY